MAVEFLYKIPTSHQDSNLDMKIVCKIISYFCNICRSNCQICDTFIILLNYKNNAYNCILTACIIAQQNCQSKFQIWEVLFQFTTNHKLIVNHLFLTTATCQRLFVHITMARMSKFCPETMIVTHDSTCKQMKVSY